MRAKAKDFGRSGRYGVLLFFEVVPTVEVLNLISVLLMLQVQGDLSSVQGLAK
jgi:hypothetical protein